LLILFLPFIATNNNWLKIAIAILLKNI
jgi:hypothetical protein